MNSTNSNPPRRELSPGPRPIRLRPTDPRRRALIVGSGPSLRVLSWFRVWRNLRAATPGLREVPDLVLLNRSAIGRTTPRYAVAVDPLVLERYQEEGLCREGGPTILTSQMYRRLGSEWPERLRELLSSSRTRIAPETWPVLACGPLAVWAMAALGYGTIYLYGYDGTIGPGVDPVLARKARTWEDLIRRYSEAGRGETSAKLVRIWPEGAAWAKEIDPLRPALAGTLVVD